MSNQIQSQESKDLPAVESAAAGFYDEAFDSDGRPRESWAGLLGSLGDYDQTELANRWETGQRSLRNHGVTYGATSSGRTIARPWELDLVPFTISPSDWAVIEQGAIQRARLQNLILKDLYRGTMRLMRDGFLPPALVFANPNYLRSCRGAPTPNDTFVHLCAIDLARAPDGNWKVLDDRIQIPGGLGYALENRTIISRLLPREFRELRVRRLNEFFAAIRQTLTELAPSATYWPRIVLLSRGAKGPAHYEHALLARYLGFTLVEGGDLTVRDQRVHLKTVEGPQRVDVILRRVNDVDCDPLELRADSLLGTPGLTQAARAGNVLIANSLGSAAVETPALLPTLPLLCRHLLHEDLILQSTETWWCGEASELNHVLANLDSLIVKSAFPGSSRSTFSGPEMTEEERNALAQRIRESPQFFVGQAAVPLSHAPIWTGSGLESKPIVLRVYVAARGDSFVVLPGGLTKVSQSSLNPVSGLKIGGGSKDTWILDTRPLPANQPPIRIESRPAGRMLSAAPSRIADNLFWLGRYSERLDHSARIVRALSSRLIDEPDSRTDAQLFSLLDMIGAEAQALPNGGADAEAATEAVLDYLYESSNNEGVAASIARISGIVATARDRFSADTWRVLHRLGEFPGPRPNVLPLNAARSMLHDLIAQLAAMSGMEMESMTRDTEWLFLDFGRRLERSMNVAELFRTAYSAGRDLEIILNPILDICDSSLTYRRRYFSEPRLDSTFETLLSDSSNPRSIAYQIKAMAEHCAAMPNTKSEGDAGELELIQELKSKFESLPIRQILDDTSIALDYFENIKQLLLQLSDGVTHRYFTLVTPNAPSGTAKGS